MYAPSPRSIVGTGLLVKLDIRVKCIHRCSAALPEATNAVSLLLLIMLGVLIGYPLGPPARPAPRLTVALAASALRPAHDHVWALRRPDHNYVACCPLLRDKSFGYYFGDLELFRSVRESGFPGAD